METHIGLDYFVNFLKFIKRHFIIQAHEFPIKEFYI